MRRSQSQLKPYQPSRGSGGALGKEITKVDRKAKVPGHSSTLPPGPLQHPQANPKKASQAGKGPSLLPTLSSGPLKWALQD